MNIRLLSATAVIALSLGAGAIAAVDPMVGGAPMYPTKNIVQNAVNSQDHTTLVAALKAAGLVPTLEQPGPFTVFAPTNEAFAALPPGTIGTLLAPENKAELTKILTYHVVAGRYDAATLEHDVPDHPRRSGVAEDRRRRTADRVVGRQQPLDHRSEGRHRPRLDPRCLPVERRDHGRRQDLDAIARLLSVSGNLLD